eukprot:m.262614 g.262614  ORF g.262614 m.262614 type:complete len:130 (-) comp15595_c0_seq4:3188-3577(-)
MSKLQRLRPLTQHVPQYARNGAAELCNWIGGAYTNASPLQPACVATAPAGSPTTSNYKVNFAANGELLFTFQETQQLDLEKAVNAAQLAQNEWASRTGKSLFFNLSRSMHYFTQQSLAQNRSMLHKCIV